MKEQIRRNAPGFDDKFTSEVEEVRQEAHFDLASAALIAGLTKAGVEVDRKNLSDMAINQPEAFAAVVASAKKALEYLKDTTPNAFEAAVKS